MSARLFRSSALVATGVATLVFLGACTSSSEESAGGSAPAAGDSGVAATASVDPGVSAATQPSTGVDASSDATAPGAGPSGDSAPATTAAAADPEATDSAAAADAGTAPAPGTAPDPATTEVPQPGGPGNITDTVAEGTVVSVAPVALDATSDTGNGVTVALSAIEAITTEAELPGEVAGPGVKVTVTLTNASSAPVELGNVVVDLQDAAGTPALPMSVGATPFTGSMAPGATATGVYVFSVPATYTNPATITVTYAADAPVAVFTGDAR